jgi:hypothetical protein
MTPARFLRAVPSVRSFIRGAIMAALAGAVVLGSGTAARADNDDQHGSKDTITFTVDIAEDFSLFNPTLVKPTDTQPERGSFFVTRTRHSMPS